MEAEGMQKQMPDECITFSYFCGLGLLASKLLIGGQRAAVARTDSSDNPDHLTKQHSEGIAGCFFFPKAIWAR
jgi:hypothetical protein